MKIDIWSDVVCPWCYIGKRRLETALEGFEGPVEITWHSFELDPSAPRTRELPLDQHLAKKYRTTLAQAHQMQARVTDAAAEEGLNFNFTDAWSGNTFDAHRLIHIAHDEGRGDDMKERLLLAYFTENQDLGDLDTLCALAVEVGLGPDAAERLRAGDKADAVRADQHQARSLGITGVPFFVIEGRYGVSGAQPADVLRKVLNEAQTELTEPAPGCDADGCAVP